MDETTPKAAIEWWEEEIEAPGNLPANLTRFLKSVAAHGHTKADVMAALPDALAAAFPGQ